MYVWAQISNDTTLNQFQNDYSDRSWCDTCKRTSGWGQCHRVVYPGNKLVRKSILYRKMGSVTSLLKANNDHGLAS